MYGKVGEQTLSSGANGSVMIEKTGRLTTGGGKHAEAALAGRMFSVANQVAVTTTADDALTWTGLGIANPSGSGINAIMHGFACAQAVIPTDEAVIGFGVGVHTADHAQNLTCLNHLPTGPSSGIYADDGATILDHQWLLPCFQVGSEGTDMPIGGNMFIDLDGMYILTPGRSIISLTTTALTSSCQFMFMWEEVPV